MEQLQTASVLKFYRRFQMVGWSTSSDSLFLNKINLSQPFPPLENHHLLMCIWGSTFSGPTSWVMFDQYQGLDRPPTCSRLPCCTRQYRLCYPVLGWGTPTHPLWLGLSFWCIICSRVLPPQTQSRWLGISFWFIIRTRWLQTHALCVLVFVCCFDDPSCLS